MSPWKVAMEQPSSAAAWPVVSSTDQVGDVAGVPAARPLASRTRPAYQPLPLHGSLI